MQAEHFLDSPAESKPANGSYPAVGHPPDAAGGASPPVRTRFDHAREDAAELDDQQSKAARHCARRKVEEQSWTTILELNTQGVGKRENPRGLVNCLWLWYFPALDAVSVAPALAFPLLFAHPRRPVSLLRLPLRPSPRRSPTVFAAIPLARLPGMKVLVASFQ